MDRKMNEAMERMSEAIERRVKKRPWHQAIAMSGERSNTTQLFTWDLAKYYIGWNDKFLLVGRNDSNWKFPIKEGDIDNALAEALKFIQYQL